MAPFYDPDKDTGAQLESLRVQVRKTEADSGVPFHWRKHETDTGLTATQSVMGVLLFLATILSCFWSYLS